MTKSASFAFSDILDLNLTKKAKKVYVTTNAKFDSDFEGSEGGKLVMKSTAKNELYAMERISCLGSKMQARYRDLLSATHSIFIKQIWL